MTQLRGKVSICHLEASAFQVWLCFFPKTEGRRNSRSPIRVQRQNPPHLPPPTPVQEQSPVSSGLRQLNPR